MDFYFSRYFSIGAILTGYLVFNDIQVTWQTGVLLWGSAWLLSLKKPW